MKDIISLSKKSNGKVTVRDILIKDVLYWVLVSAGILALNVVVAIVIGFVQDGGSLYTDGLNGISAFPVLYIVLGFVATVAISRSIEPETWIAWIVSIAATAYISQRAIVSGVLPGTVIPQLCWIIIVFVAIRIFEAVQVNRYVKTVNSSASVSWWGVVAYSLLLTLLLSISIIRL